MKNLLTTVNVQVCEKLFLKDPESSELGKRIIMGSIEQIDELGFEGFNFRKLANYIKTTEASIYRYFESKNKVLLYLTSWYWSWMEYHLVFQITNVKSVEERLKRAIALMTSIVEVDHVNPHIDEKSLQRIVFSESMKAYMNKEVDQENKEGAFKNYKQFVGRVSEIIQEASPNYKYPHMLVSTVIEGAHLQHHFAKHLPSLTNITEEENTISSFYLQVVLNTINNQSEA